jgi:hypothetical protein
MVTNWLAELDGRRVTVEVPASSANLGAGYDCLGVALGLTNRVAVEVRGWSRGEIDLVVDGEGAEELPADRTNRCVLGIEAVLHEVRGELPPGVGWRIEMANEIPLARGLGSSAAATIAGLVAGNTLLGEPLTQGDLLRLATGIEGHPDNATAALLGGFTACALIDGTVADWTWHTQEADKCIDPADPAFQAKVCTNVPGQSTAAWFKVPTSPGFSYKIGSFVLVTDFQYDVTTFPTSFTIVAVPDSSSSTLMSYLSSRKVTSSRTPVESMIPWSRKESSFDRPSPTCPAD